MQAPDVFVAGVIQGSEHEHRIVDQDYRTKIRAIIEAEARTLTIYDPIEHHPQALEYDLKAAHSTFFGHVALVRRSRVLVAYLPEASLGNSSATPRVAGGPTAPTSAESRGAHSRRGLGGVTRNSASWKCGDVRLRG